MHGYHRVELLQIDLGDRDKLGRHPCVVHQAIEASKVVHGKIDHRLDIGFDRNIRAYEPRGLPEHLCESLAPLLASASNHDPGAFGDENFGGARADATCTTCDNRDFSFKYQHNHRLLSEAG